MLRAKNHTLKCRGSVGEEGKGRSALFVGRTRNLPKPLPQCLEDGYEHFRPKLLNHRMQSDKLKKLYMFSMILFVIIIISSIIKCTIRCQPFFEERIYCDNYDGFQDST